MVAKGCLVVDMCTCGHHVNTLHTKTNSPGGIEPQPIKLEFTIYPAKLWIYFRFARVPNRTLRPSSHTCAHGTHHNIFGGTIFQTQPHNLLMFSVTLAQIVRAPMRTWVRTLCSHPSHRCTQLTNPKPLFFVFLRDLWSRCA